MHLSTKPETIDLRLNVINDLRDANDLIQDAQRYYPEIKSIIITPTQEKAIAASDPNLKLSMEVANRLQSPTQKIVYRLEILNGIPVEVE